MEIIHHSKKNDNWKGKKESLRKKNSTEITFGCAIVEFSFDVCISKLHCLLPGFINHKPGSFSCASMQKEAPLGPLKKSH